MSQFYPAIIKRAKVFLFALSFLLLPASLLFAQTITNTFTTSGTFTVPAGVTSITVEAWGAGGGGSTITTNTSTRGGGGGGGAYARSVINSFTGSRTYNVVVGSGGAAGSAGGNSTFNSTTVVAAGGRGGGNNSAAAGAGGSDVVPNSRGDIRYAGGNGAAGGGTFSGGGGGGAGSGGSGSNAPTAANGSFGTGIAINGGDGGASVSGGTNGKSGNTYGGGGSGASTNSSTDRTGGNGADGLVVISYDVPAGHCGGGAVAVTSSNSITSPNNALGAPDGNSAIFNATNDVLVLDLTGGNILSTGGSVDVIWARTGTSTNPTVRVDFSPDNISWTTGSSFTVSNTTLSTTNITLSVPTRYIRFTPTGISTTRTILLDAVSFLTPCTPPCTDPVINTQPSDNTPICAGANTSFTVAATGTSLTYQWQVSTGGAYSDISNTGVYRNATTTTLNINAATAAMDGYRYRVVISSGACNTTSVPVTLTVNSAPAQPSAITGTTPVCAGSTQTYSVTNVTGVTYTWNTPTGWTLNSGQGTRTVTYFVGTSGGTVQVTPSNTCGNGTARTLAVAVSTPASITLDPVSQVICAGKNVTFTSTATGSPLSYQWQKNGTNITGATSVNYTITNVATTDAGNYNVVVTAAGCGSVTSANATLTVNSLGITTQPVDQTICTGNPVTFSVAASGTSPFSYQWRKGGVDIAGATSSTFTKSNVIATDGANYSVAVTNVCGTVISANALLTVGITPSISKDPESSTKCIGEPVTFTITATGNPLTFQWRKNGANITGANAFSYTITSIVAGSADNYDVVVTAATCGSVTSAEATLTVNTPVSISTQPAAQTICIGSPVTFSVTAAATLPLSYQWKKGGVDISGATNSTFSIAEVNSADAANYSVVITNPCGSLTSNNAALIVNSPIGNNNAGSESVICSGTSPGTLQGSTPTGGSGTYTYNWEYSTNGTTFSNATGTRTGKTYSPGNLTVSTWYRRTVTAGVCGSDISDPVLITVNPVIANNSVSAAQTICTNSSPETLTGSTPTGGDGVYTYSWDQSTNGTTWTNIGGSNSSDYSPGTLTANRWFRRVVTSGGCSSTSSSVQISVNTNIGNNTITASQTICSGSIPVALTGTAPNGGGGKGTYTYLWESSTTSATAGFSSASGTNTNSGYSPSTLTTNTWFRRTVISGPCANNVSKAILITVNPVIAGNDISSAQTICSGFAPANLTGGTLIGGSGTYTYNWESSTNGSSFSNAGGTRNGVSYSPGVLTVTTWYRRTVTSGGCTDISSPIKITVNPLPAITNVSGDGTFCGSTIITASGGSGGTRYFQGKTSNGTSTTTPSSSETVTTSGTYYFRSMSAAGCWGPEGSVEVIINAKPTGNITITENSGNANNDGIICVGGSITFTAPSGYTSYIFKDGGGNTLQAGGPLVNTFSTSSLPLGTSVISVDVVGDGNCAATLGPVIVIVNALPAPMLTITGIQADKSACPSVPVTLTAAANTGSTYSFIVNGATVITSTSNTYTIPSITGTTTVAVMETNSNGCKTTTAIQTITVNPVPSGTLTSTDNSGVAPNDRIICAGDNITFTASLGTIGSTYNFKVNGMSVQNDDRNIFSSTAITNGQVVTVEVTNASGCTASYGGTLQFITVNPLPIVSLSATETSGPANDNIICKGATVTFNATATGTNNNYKFFIKGNPNPVQNGAGSTYTNSTLANGDIVYVMVTSAGGCSTTSNEIAIEVINAPAGILTASSPSVCAGGSITLEANTGYSNYNFKRNNVTFSNGSSNTATVIPLSSSDVFTVEVSNTQTCTAVFNSVSIVVNPLPTGTLSIAETSGLVPNDGKICKGAKVTFTAPIGFTNYNFKINEITVQNGTGRIFEVTTLNHNDVVSVEVTNATNCFATLNSYTITVNDLSPVLPITAVKTEVCVGDLITLVAPTLGGTWSTGNSSIAAVDASGVVTGKGPGTATIYYTVKNSNNCDSIVSIDIIVNALPSVDPISGASKVCVGSSTQLSETTPDGVWSSNDDNLATVDQTGLVTGVGAGSVVISYTVTNEEGCVTVVTRNIAVNALPEVSGLVVAKEICVGENMTLTYTSSGGTNVWSSSDVTVATVNQFGLVRGVSDGTVTITLTVTNVSTGCSSSVQADVIVNALPVPTLSGNPRICPNTIERYNTESGQFDYTWTVVGGTIVPITGGGGTNDDFVFIEWGNTGTKSVYVNYKNASGCTAATFVTIANGDVASPTFYGDLTVCQNTSGKVYTAPLEKENYTWTVIGGVIISGDNTNEVTVIWTDAGNQSITLNYAEPDGCNAATPTVKTVVVNPEPTLLIKNPDAVCSPSTVDLTKPAVKAPGTTAGLTYTYWTDAAATIAVSDATKVGAGTFYIKGTTTPGCFVIKPVTVTVNPTPTVVITNPAAVCSPGTADLTLAGVTYGSTAGLIFDYYIDAAGTNVLSGQTSVVAGTYYIKGSTALGCSEIKPVDVTVNPLPTATIGGNTTVCQNSAAPVITFTGANGTAPYTFTYKINSGGNLTVTSTGNTATVSAPTNSAGSLVYTLVSVQDASTTLCTNPQAGTATVNIDPISVGGAVTSSTTVCYGSNSGTLNLAGNTGTIIRWESSTNGGANWTTINNTTASYTYNNLTQTTQFRAVVQSGTCSTANSTAATITITPVSVGGTIGGSATVCAGTNSTTLTLTGHVSTILRWESSSDGGTTWNTLGGGINASRTFNNLTQTTMYRVVVSNGVCSSVNSTTATITVNPRPTGVISGTQSICTGLFATLTIKATGTGTISGTLSNGAIFSGTAPTITVSVNPSANIIYTIATLKDANCTAIAGDITGSAVVTVNPLPAPPTITPSSATICQESILPLSAGTAPTSGSKNNSYSGSLSITDNNTVGSANSLNISGIPTGAVISSVSINFNITHGRTADLIINLKAPNGNVLNLVNVKGGTGFNNTTINSSSNTVIPGTGNHTGTYRPDGVNRIVGASAGGGNTSNVTTFASLYTIPNGNWTFSVRDAARNNTGTITSWSITINYTVISGPAAVVWSPLTDLYSDAGGENPYDGSPMVTVYSKPSTATDRTYTATTTNGNGCVSSSTVLVRVNRTPVVSIIADYCQVPGKVRLMASAVPAVPNNSYVWSTGQTGSTIDVDIADEYTVSASLGGCSGFATISVAQELVINGDFSDGNDGSFESDYAYKVDINGRNDELVDDSGNNGYSITTDGQRVHNNFWGLDHTNNATGPRNFMAVNGHGKDLVIWKQTVNVLPNTTYYFSAWGMSLNSAGPFAQLQFSVNGDLVGTAPVLPAGVNNNNNGYTGNARWTRFYGTWTSGPTTTTADIYINNLQEALGGNDFGLDDISFGTLSTFITLVSDEGTDAQTDCSNTPITDIVYNVGNGSINPPTVKGLPDGVIPVFEGDKLTLRGTPTVAGDYTYTITTSTTGTCPPATATGTIKVLSQTMALKSGSSSPIVCINTALTNIVYEVGGSATGASVTSGPLPAGLIGVWDNIAKTFTISGTPTVAGAFDYTVTTSGNCAPAAFLTGKITVQNQTIELTSGAGTQAVCINERISTMVYTVGGTGDGAGVTGLPPGVTGFYSGGAFVISGTPIAPAAGTYNFTVTTTGPCLPGAVLTGSITVNPIATIALTSGNNGQTVCINTDISAINYAIGGGGTGASITSGALPNGVTGSYTGGVFTISGKPTEAGTFNYTISTTGTCGQTSMSGSMIVQTQSIVLTTGGVSPTLCIGSTLNNIVFTIGGTGSNAVLSSGSFPNGITGSYDPGTKKYTISGSPSELGTFSYSISTTGTCEIANIAGTIIVNSGSIGGTLVPDMISGCGTASGNLNLKNNVGGVVHWERSTDGANWTVIANTTTTLPYNVNVPTQFRAFVKSGSCNGVYSAVALIALQNYWTGAESNDWQNVKNWSDNQLPGLACTNVYIPKTANNPVLSNGSSAINNIIIDAGAILTINGTGVLKIAGAITNNGTFDVKNGSLEFNGNAIQTISGSIFKDKTIKDLTISNTSASGLNLTSTANDTLNITGSVSFGTAYSVFTTNDNLTLKSTVEGTASVGVLKPDNDITGNVTVERYIPTGTKHEKSWELLAIPTGGNQSINAAWQEGATLSNVNFPADGSLGNPNKGYGTMIVSAKGGNASGARALGFDEYTAPGPSMKTYLSATNTYDAGPADTKTTPIYNKKGYMVLVRGDRSVFVYNQPATQTTLRTKGPLFTPKNPPVSTTVPAGLFESIGNPYASPIDLIKLNPTGDVGKFYYVWDPKLGGAYGLGAFQVLGQTGGGSDINFYPNPGGGSYGSTSTPHNYIECGQAFIMSSSGAAGSLSFSETDKYTASIGSNTMLRGQGGQEKQTQLRTNLFSVSSNGAGELLDGVLIQYNDEYSNAIDKLDARKVTNVSENLAIRSGGKELAVERRSPILETDTIFYKLTTVKVQKYRYEYIASGLGDFDVEGFIEDVYLGTKTPLNMEGKTTVDFNIVNIPGSYAADRFRIVFKEIARPLPVTFVSVKATQQKDDIIVDWKLENETNVTEYEVEKSLDGNRFIKSASVSALNNGAGSYSWLDKDVTPGWNYYRIKSIDQNGKVSYSEVVRVMIEIVAPLITVYPNPIVNGVINVHLINQPAGTYKLRLLNALGQTMVAKQVTREKGTSVEPLTWDYKLARGNYRIEITKPDGSVKLITVIY